MNDTETKISERYPLETKKTRKVRPWTTEEKEAVATTFSNHIKNGKLPKKEECMKFIDENREILDGRMWSHVKDNVRACIKKKP